MVFYDRQHDSVTQADNGGQVWYWARFRPKQAGPHSFTGTLFVNGKHKHKTICFAVQR